MLSTVTFSLLVACASLTVEGFNRWDKILSPRFQPSNPLRFHPAAPQVDQVRTSSLKAGVSAKPCCFPKTWQGTMFRDPSDLNMHFQTTIYEDDVNQRFAVDVIGKHSTIPPISPFAVYGPEIFQVNATSKTAYVFLYDKKGEELHASSAGQRNVRWRYGALCSEWC